MAALRFAWILNLDADVELAAIASGVAGARTGYAPKKGVMEAMRLFAPKLAARLLDPQIDLVIDEHSPLLVARGLIGRAFCPTPRALRLLIRAGAELEPQPDCDVLVRVNSRAFCSSLGTTLEGAAFVTTEEEARARLATSPPEAVAKRWRVKRNFGMTGRGQRIVESACMSDSDFAFVRAGLSEGGVQIEPDVKILSELAIHGVLAANGAFVLGPVVQQHCDARGAWMSSEPLSPRDAPAEMVAEAERVAAALCAEKYFGPFGVDAFAYQVGEAGGKIALQPRSEINARFTMGFAAPRE
ncbi:MAG: ATP-grasp domain-containing protein [Polyangiaceae bacterium]